MKYLALTLLTILSSIALADGACEQQVSDAVAGPDMVNVVNQVHVSKTNPAVYAVIYYGDSGDEEKASVDFVHVNPETCEILSIQNKKQTRE